MKKSPDAKIKMYIGEMWDLETLMAIPRDAAKLEYLATLLEAIRHMTETALDGKAAHRTQACDIAFQLAMEALRLIGPIHQDQAHWSRVFGLLTKYGVKRGPYAAPERTYDLKAVAAELTAADPALVTFQPLKMR